MPVYAFEDKEPRIDPTAFVHPEAVIIGSVQIGPECFIGPGAILRGDFGDIMVSEGASVQDNAVIHVNERTRAFIGPGCIIAHGATLHHPELERDVMVGMNAVILHGSKVGASCVIASLCVLKEGSVFGPGKLIAGIPGRVVREVSDAMKERIRAGAAMYRELAKRYQEGLRRLD